MNKVTYWLKHLLFTILLSIYLVSGFAQKLPYQILVLNNSGDTLKTHFGSTNSLSFTQLVKKENNNLLNDGFVLAYVDKLKLDSINFSATLQRGNLYKWGVFDVSNIPKILLSKFGFKTRKFENTPINSKVIGALMVNVITDSERSGYPFASIKLDSVSISSSQISAILNYNSGPLIKYADLVLNNTSKVKNVYLAAYLEIKKDHVFDSKKVESIAKKIEKLAYCKLSTSPIIEFENKSCKITLNVEPLMANKIDAMVGLAPNQGNKTKLLATGYVDLHLYNLFQSGKELSFKWSQFGVQSQTVSAFYNHTNLLKSVLNVKSAFDLLKQDTAFINRNFYVAFGYDRPNYNLNLTSQFLASRLLSNTTSDDAYSLDRIDFDTQLYGIELLKTEFDNKLNPTKGWSVESGLKVGVRNLIHSSFVPIEIFDSLAVQTLQGTANLIAEMAIPISKIVIGYSKVSIAGWSSKSKLYTNDLFRLGGVNSIRGFNELQIYTSSYIMLQLEGRVLLSKNSRLFGFVDWAYTENQVSLTTEKYTGLGAGMLLDTNSGVVQLVYAVGKSSKQLLSLAESKIHIGYVARF